MQPVFQQNSQRRSVRHAELLAVRARVSSQRPFFTGGGFLVLVISCGRDAAKLFPQFPGTGCFLPLAVSYGRPFPVAGRFLRLAHHPSKSTEFWPMSETCSWHWSRSSQFSAWFFALTCLTSAASCSTRLRAEQMQTVTKAQIVNAF